MALQCKKTHLLCHFIPLSLQYQCGKSGSIFPHYFFPSTLVRVCKETNGNTTEKVLLFLDITSRMCVYERACEYVLPKERERVCVCQCWRIGGEWSVSM